MRSRAYTGDAGKSSVTMLKIWPTPLRIRTSPINRTRNYSQTPPQADTVTVTYHLATHSDRAYIPAAFKTHGKIPSVKLDRPSSSPLSLNRTERSSDNNSYDVACQQCYEHISLRSRPTWCLSIHIFKYIHNLVFQITMSDTSIRLGLRLSS